MEINRIKGIISQYGRHLLLSVLLIVWLYPAVFSTEIPSYLFSTAIILVVGLWVVIEHGVLTFRTILYAIIFLPSFSPFFAWNIMDKWLFSLAAPELQFDKLLVDKAMYIYAAASVPYAFFGVLSSRSEFQKDASDPVSNNFFSSHILWIIAALTIVGAYFIESGPTVLTTSYADMKADRSNATPLVALLGVTFGGFWSLLFVYGRNRKILFGIVTALIFIWLFLHVRRVELFGIAFVLFFWAKYFLKPVPLYALFVGFVIIQISLGYIRYVPWLSYFSQSTEEMQYSQVFKKQFTETQQLYRDKKTALPGGASNVFLSGLHLFNLKDRKMLTDSEEFTMSQWIPSLVPNTVWGYLGKEGFTTEHEAIYKRLGLVYVGGMPLLAVFYLNGGLWFVVIFGFLHGYLAGRVDKVFDQVLKPNLVYGGALSLLVASIFVFYQFRLQWYNPQTMLRAIVYSLIIYFFIYSYIHIIRFIRQKN